MADVRLILARNRVLIIVDFPRPVSPGVCVCVCVCVCACNPQSMNLLEPHNDIVFMGNIHIKSRLQVCHMCKSKGHKGGPRKCSTIQARVNVHAVPW